MYLPSNANCDKSPLALLSELSLFLCIRPADEITLLNLGLAKVLETIVDCFLDVAHAFAHLSNTLNSEQPIVLSSSVTLTQQVSVFGSALAVCTFLSSSVCLVSVMGTSETSSSRSSKVKGPATKDEASRTVLGASSACSSIENGVLPLGLNSTSSAGNM